MNGKLFSVSGFLMFDILTHICVLFRFQAIKDLLFPQSAFKNSCILQSILFPMIRAVVFACVVTLKASDVVTAVWCRAISLMNRRPMILTFSNINKYWLTGI